MHKKPLSTGWALFYFAIASAFFLSLVSVRHGPDEDAAVVAPPEVAVPVDLYEDVSAAQELLTRDPDAALKHIERALERADVAGPQLSAVLYTWAASVHSRRWHWHRARDALNNAIKLEPNDERRRALAGVEESILRAQGERDMQSSYRAARNAGPARALRGRVVVAYVLADPIGPRRWSDVDRVFARSTLARVERWYAAIAAVRGVVAPVFVDRVFEVPLAAGDLPVFPDVDRARRTALQLVENLGHDSLREWLGALQSEEAADQVMLFVHSPQNARSFSSVCARGGYCDSELALVYVPNGPTSWDTLGFTLAHEGLHLFGADDLYNVSGAADYATTDVMHYVSARLEYAELGDLTAWAVGWAPNRPITPFIVEE